MSDVKQKHWTFEEWSDTFDGILKMYERVADIKGKMRYTKMLMEHCLRNYDKLWNRGL